MQYKGAQWWDTCLECLRPRFKLDTTPHQQEDKNKRPNKWLFREKNNERQEQLIQKLSFRQKLIFPQKPIAYPTKSNS